jgi:hypothetical protein
MVLSARLCTTVKKYSNCRSSEGGGNWGRWWWKHLLVAGVYENVSYRTIPLLEDLLVSEVEQSFSQQFICKCLWNVCAMLSGIGICGWSWALNTLHCAGYWLLMSQVILWLKLVALTFLCIRYHPLCLLSPFQHPLVSVHANKVDVKFGCTGCRWRTNLHEFSFLLDVI